MTLYIYIYIYSSVLKTQNWMPSVAGSSPALAAGTRLLRRQHPHHLATLMHLFISECCLHPEYWASNPRPRTRLLRRQHLRHLAEMHLFISECCLHPDLPEMSPEVLLFISACCLHPECWASSPALAAGRVLVYIPGTRVSECCLHLFISECCLHPECWASSPASPPETRLCVCVSIYISIYIYNIYIYI